MWARPASQCADGEGAVPVGCSVGWPAFTGIVNPGWNERAIGDSCEGREWRSQPRCRPGLRQDDRGVCCASVDHDLDSVADLDLRLAVEAVEHAETLDRMV